MPTSGIVVQGFAEPIGRHIFRLLDEGMLGYFAGVPTASISGYGKGAIAIDYTNGNWYRNTGSKTSATWTLQTGTITTQTITNLTTTTLVVGGTESVAGVLTPTGGVAAAGGFTATPCGQINTSGYPAIVSTYGTDSTPTTTSVYVVEIFIPCNMTITGVNYLNGTAVGNGTVRIGLYTSAGVAIAAALTAATTTAGIDSYQAVAFATPYAAVGPAKYLIGFQFSSATDRYNTHVSGFTQGFSIAQASATIGVTTISPLPTAVVAGAAVVASLY